MKRVAIVVQRCHESVVGGAEALAWQYAQLLSTGFDVEVLTSTAIDYISWKNAIEPGVRMREGISVRAFSVSFERGDYWRKLYLRTIGDAPPGGAPQGAHFQREGVQEEFIRFQGPHCPDLEIWLRDHGHEYAAVIFCTYLYSTTYFAIRAVCPRKAILVPTLHDEPPAYFSVFAQRYARYEHRIWLTRAEQRVAARLWGFDEGDVIGMAVMHAQSTRAETRKRPYLLYCGRIDSGKGCDELLNAFTRLPSRLGVSLVLTGVDNMGLPRSPDIEYLGFVDEQRKLALMAGAVGFVLPSRYESFSIVTLEAMAQRTPVLVNARCEVMRDHVDHSGGGFHYASTDEMVRKMEQLCTLTAEERSRIGTAGHDYVLANYRESIIRERLIDLVERVIANSDDPAN
ncbi:MAG: glycosyltransferase family 4 protein [Dokdonella sp.]